LRAEIQGKKAEIEAGIGKPADVGNSQLIRSIIWWFRAKSENNSWNRKREKFKKRIKKRKRQVKQVKLAGVRLNCHNQGWSGWSGWAGWAGWVGGNM